MDLSVNVSLEHPTNCVSFHNQYFDNLYFDCYFRTKYHIEHYKGCVNTTTNVHVLRCGHGLICIGIYGVWNSHY